MELLCVWKALTYKLVNNCSILIILLIHLCCFLSNKQQLLHNCCAAFGASYVFIEWILANKISVTNRQFSICGGYFYLLNLHLIVVSIFLSLFLFSNVFLPTILCLMLPKQKCHSNSNNNENSFKFVSFHLQ